MPRRRAPNIGAAVRRARVAAGMTQADLANRAGIAVETASRLERGGLAPSAELLLRVADALEVTMDSLVRPAVRPPPSSLRLVERRLLAVVHDLADADVDVMIKSIKSLLGVGRRASSRNG